MTTKTKVQKKPKGQETQVTRGTVVEPQTQRSTVVELQALRSAMVDRETLRATVKRLEIEKELLKDMLKEALAA
jgi:hypothetical protein